MNIYPKLAKQCWNILRKYRHNLAIFSNSWLYFLHDHPEFTKNYEHPSKTKIKKKIKLKKVFFNKKKNTKKYDFLIISHLNNINMLNINEDFYFGDIQNFLSKRKKKSCLALIDHTKDFDKKLFKYKKSDKAIIPLDISIINNIEIYTSLLISIIFFYYNVLINKVFFKKNHYAYQVLKLSTFKSSIQNLIIRKHILKLLTEYNPKFIITTFEGHPYERIIYNISKKFNKKIKTIGYQFSILKKNQFSIFQDLSKENNPDIILFSGPTTEKIFKKKAKYKYISKVIGSKNCQLLKNKKINNKNILVCPEGLEDEYKIFLKFIIQYQKKYKDSAKFIFREHPRLSVKNLDNYNSIKRDLKTIIFSKRDIKKDFQTSSYIFYRGSGTVINAVSNKIIPIYLRTNNPADIDPLYDKKILRIGQVHQLKKILKVKQNISLDLVNYTRNYFQKINYKKLLEL